jgi:hypothetical protein
MINRNCIFCGKTPSDKDCEHILPKWLLKLTGDDSRTVPIGYSWKKQKELNFSLTSFKFPSCKECNSKYSRLESKAKFVVEKILVNEDLDHEELTVLLDWFDKIRTGIWLSVLYFNNELFGINPHFFINDRVRREDRALLIYNLQNEKEGLSWFGSSTLCFIYQPSCFGLKINKTAFISISSEFITSEYLGFPYPKSCNSYPSKEALRKEYLLHPNRDGKSQYLFDTKISQPHVKLIQPIFKNHNKQLAHLYDNEYINENSYDIENGIGKILKQIIN